MTAPPDAFARLLAEAARLKIESNEAFWRAHEAWPQDKGSSEFMELLKAEQMRQLEERAARAEADDGND